MQVTKTTLVTCTTRLFWLAAALLATLALAVPAARADGDPASDYLLAGLSFLSPYDGHIPTADQKKINAMLASAKKQGFPLRVAVIVTPYDLGAVPILFNAPQRYAKFLASEDFYYWKDELLVVMPKGYGIYKAKGLPAADRAAIGKLAPPAGKNGAALAAAAETAIQTLATQHGLKLSTGGGVLGSSSSVWGDDRARILGAAILVCLLAFGVRFLRRWRKAAV
jgi:hypothetical protein